MLTGVPLHGIAAQPTPETMEQAFHSLDSLMSKTQRDAFMHKPEREATVETHMSFGLYIRNEWFRRGKSSLVAFLFAKGAQSLDDASAIILTSYWRYLNGKPINLEAQGACYAEWWAEERLLRINAEKRNQNSYSPPDFNCPRG
jgi:hypothetical protein